MSNKVKYPDISVKLTGQNGNAFMIIGKVNSALRRGGVPQSEIKKFTNEAMRGDYDNLLQTAMRWVEVE
jgi:hypothetical protein